MKNTLAFIFLLAAMTSCSSGPRHMAGQDFRRAYESRNRQTLARYVYLGEVEGSVYMLRSLVPLIGSKPKQKVFYTEKHALDPGFMRKMRGESKNEPEILRNPGESGFAHAGPIFPEDRQAKPATIPIMPRASAE